MTEGLKTCAIQLDNGQLEATALTFGPGRALTFHADGRVEASEELKPDDIARHVIDQIMELWPKRAPALHHDEKPEPFQERVRPWMQECFGPEISADRLERNDRFIEEALELAQATGYSAERAHALVTYVFNRPAGEPPQEVGGVMVTLAALCLAHGLDMAAAGDAELTRISAPEVIEKIRAKQAAKPTGSALPVPSAGQMQTPDVRPEKHPVHGWMPPEQKSWPPAERGTHLTLEHVPDAEIDAVLAELANRLHGEVTVDRVALATMAICAERDIDLRPPKKRGEHDG